jgi:hypothetical protein
MTGVDAATAASNQKQIATFKQVVADATKLPIDHIQVLTW